LTKKCIRKKVLKKNKIIFSWINKVKINMFLAKKDPHSMKIFEKIIEKKRETEKKNKINN
jgi:hypothetical protein